MDLAERFQVSRFTIREALDNLSEAGLISRHQGARSRVIGHERKSIYTFSVGSAEDLLQYAFQTYLEVTSVMTIEARPASLARFLKCRDGKEWILLRGNRRDSGTSEIIGYNEVYLWKDFEAHLPEITKRGIPVYQQIETVLDIQATKIVQNISAIVMPEDAANAIGCEVGSPGLEIVRYYLGSRGSAFEVARNIHAAEHYTYSQSFRRESENVGEH
jgi:DNA-binding GntR family transcriptional regulator